MAGASKAGVMAARGRNENSRTGTRARTARLWRAFKLGSMAVDGERDATSRPGSRGGGYRPIAKGAAGRDAGVRTRKATGLGVVREGADV